MLCSYSKAYIKGEFNNCKGRTSAHSNKGVGVLHYLLFALYITSASFHFFTFSPFHPFTFIPGEVRGMYLSADSVKRAKSVFGNKSICAMGIISYPEFAQFI